MERLLPRYRQRMLGELGSLGLSGRIGHLEPGEKPFGGRIHEYRRQLAIETHLVAAQESTVATIEPQSQRGVRLYAAAVIAKEEQLTILEDHWMNDTDDRRAAHDGLWLRCLIRQTHDEGSCVMTRIESEAPMRSSYPIR